MEKQCSEIKKKVCVDCPLKCCYVVSSVFYAMHILGFLGGGGVFVNKA